MAVAFRASSTTGAGDSNISTCTIPRPTGTVSGDIVLAAIEIWTSGSGTVAVTPPTGFTQIVDINLDADSGWQKLKVFWKRAGGSEPASYVFTLAASNWNQGQAIAISGAKASGDPIGVNINTATAATVTTSIPTTTLSSLAFQPFLAHFVANESSASQTTVPTSFTNTQNANYLKSNYRVPGSTGSFSASGGVLNASTSIVAALIAVEPDTGGSSVAVNTATEADASQSIGKRKTKAITFPTETETAPPVARSKHRGLTQAVETDTALGFIRSKRKSVSQAVSTETAQPIGRLRSRTLGTASSTEQALPIGKVKRKSVGTATATDAAVAIGSTSGISQPIGTATETEIALPIGYRRSKPIGTAVEVDSALPAEFVNPAWRLVVPTIQEKYALPSTRGALLVSNYREVTVFGDDDDLFTTALGVPSEGTDEYGAIPFGTKYIWYGGHVNTTDDPAIRDLWLAHGFEVEIVSAS
jgi:hypothetical protein